jgi:transposase InsO family protein
MNGIKRQLTTTYIPQQNGVAERKNHTMVEMSRSMLQTKGLNNSYWADSVSTSIYILNGGFISDLEKMTQYEAWYEKRPSANNFKFYGCLLASLIRIRKSYMLKVNHVFL